MKGERSEIQCLSNFNGVVDVGSDYLLIYEVIIEEQKIVMIGLIISIVVLVLTTIMKFKLKNVF